MLAANIPKGALLIPFFAVELAQELISDIGRLTAAWELPDIPINVDRPLATRATKVFADHFRELEGGAVLVEGLKARNLHFAETREQSMALDQRDHQERRLPRKWSCPHMTAPRCLVRK